MSFPFKDAYSQYRNRGWIGTLPLPKEKKESPPTDWTGKRAKYPDPDLIQVWIREKKYKDGNICIRLAGVTKEYEIIGIDVDHYESGGKNKLGYDQLEDLERKYGPLPPTAISSARSDGKSGIRYFLVPRGLAFRGQAAKDIDIISKGYRYALVWPSIHPNGSIYLWYKPGDLIDGNGTDEIPLAKNLPLLPEAWLDYLTANKTEFTIHDIDMDCVGDDALDWATDNFPNIHEMCFRMRQKLEIQKRDIKADPSSHDKIVKAHYNITRLAAEGHYGWYAAIVEIEQFWSKDVINRQKRGKTELENEVKRSRINCVRIIKLQIEAAGGIPPDDPECCGASELLEPPYKYKFHDDDNGRHFHDLFNTSDGTTIRYISDWKQWILWTEVAEDLYRWVPDDEDGGKIRRAWWQVKKRQEQYAANLKASYDNQVAQATSQALPTRGSAAAVPDALVEARNKYNEWKDWALKSGMNYNAEQAIRACAKRNGVHHVSDELDQHRELLGVANGVLELGENGVTFRENRMEDLITFNTNVEWKEHADELDPKGVDLWNDFLDMFIPDLETRRIIQIAIGYCLLGWNKERVFMIALGQTSSGKSTFARVIGKAFGDLAAPVGKTMFQNNKFKPSLTRNKDKRLLTNTEFDNNVTVSTAVIKELSGGSDILETEVKHQDAVKLSDPQFVTLVATNQLFKLNEPDLAIQRRLYILEFNEVIARELEKKDFATLLEKYSLPAILKWAVDGYLMYIGNGGLIHNEHTSALTREAMADMDVYSEFMETCLEFHEHHDNFHIDEGVWTKDRPEWCIENTAMRSHFKAWWYDNDYKERDFPSANSLTRRLLALGMRKPKKPLWVNGKAGRYWLGVKFKPGAKIFTIQPQAFKTNTN
jgi:P4 family phage/plasmid primase-like protien